MIRKPGCEIFTRDANYSTLMFALLVTRIPNSARA